MKKRFFVYFVFLILCMAGVMGSGRTGQAAEEKELYMIKVNKQQNVVTVYKRNPKGKYKPYKAFVCSTGTATPLGTYSVGAKYRWHELMGPSYGQYCTRIYKGILFHSVWYYRPSKNTQSYVQYNRLGTTASHGCIRLTVAASKWIYDNCPAGTSIVIYNSPNPGPLGKPRARKMSGYMGWDPTDPDPNNPYFIKVRSLRISASRKTLTLGTGKAKAKYRLRVTKLRPGKAMIKKVRYVSSRPKIATVNQKGVVRAKKPGTCRITVQTTDGSGIRRVCRIKVKKAAPPPAPRSTAEPEQTPVPPTEPEVTEAVVPESETR